MPPGAEAASPMLDDRRPDAEHPPVSARWGCPLCALDEPQHVGREGQFDVARCRRCGLAYVRPRPTDSDLHTFYNESYYASDQAGSMGFTEYRRHEPGIRLVARERLTTMRTYLQPGRLLDVGCAYGFFLDAAREAGWDAVGVELAAAAAARARTEFDLDVRAGTLHEQAWPDGAFDAVTLWDALEHTLDPLAILREVHRILRPGGYCFLTVPDAGTWIARLLGRHWFGYRKAGEHTFFFTRDTVRTALARTEFTTVHVGQGIWPCDLAFLAEKFAQYSPLVSRVAGTVLQGIGLGDRVVRFPLIDMQVVARRPEA